MTLRAHLTPTVVAVAVTSALVGGGTAYGVTTLIDGHRLVNHTVDAWKLTAAAQQYLRGRTGATGPGLFSTVPSGKTLTGNFLVTLPYQNGGVGLGLVNFQEAFSGRLAAEWVPAGQTTANCPGTYQVPTAAPGHFCAYIDAVYGDVQPILDPAPTPSSPSGYTGTMGAMLSIDAHAPNPAAYAQGSWAATAP